MTDSEKLDLILEMLDDLYHVLMELAPWLGVRLLEPIGLARWRMERERKHGQSA